MARFGSTHPRPYIFGDIWFTITDQPALRIHNIRIWILTCEGDLDYDLAEDSDIVAQYGSGSDFHGLDMNQDLELDGNPDPALDLDITPDPTFELGCGFGSGSLTL